MSNWDLTYLFKTEEDFEQEILKLEKDIQKLAEYQGKLDDFKQFENFHKEKEAVESRFGTAYQYAGLASSLNSKDTKLVGYEQKMQMMAAQFGTVVSFADPEIISLGKETVDAFVQKSDFLKQYEYLFDNTFRQQKHVLDKSSEQLLANHTALKSSLANTYAALSTADIEFQDVTLSTGETVKVTSGSYAPLIKKSKTPADRALVAKTFFQHYAKRKSTYAAIYNSIIQANISTTKSRNYENTLTQYLDENNIPTEVYHSLVKVTRENTAPVKRYYELRKRHLGLDKTHSYDRFIPLSSSDKELNYAEGEKLFFDSIKDLSQDFQTKAKMSMEKGFVDVHEKNGKRSGAFSWSVSGKRPFILLNYMKTLGDVFTLAHEAGHSIHSLYTNEAQPFATQNYTIFVAEVASTFNEHKLLDYMLTNSKLSKDDKVVLLQEAIDGLLGTYYRQVLFATYELEAFTKAEAGQPITHETLSGIMRDLHKEYYDIDLNDEENLEGTFAVVPHFFRTPFYVYQYATCYATSLKLYEDVKAGKEGAFERYIDLLKSGGSNYPVKQVLEAGVDLTKTDAFLAVVNRLDSLVTELEQLLR